MASEWVVRPGNLASRWLAIASQKQVGVIQAKNCSKIAMTLIFFPVKAENVYFTTMIKGAFKGAFLSFYFTLKVENHFQNE